ncbi:MAG: radical SAM protein, partial [Planctomycetota bacterium]
MTGPDPCYLAAYESGALAEKAERALEKLASCTVCARNCEVNRLEHETGVCQTGRHPHVSSAFPHLGEEDCLRGSRGSGTIFFSYCNLRCVFCQNYEISWDGGGQVVSPPELATLLVALQKERCHNINFVTPSHVVPQILEALPIAVENGLRLPIVYNTGAYDALDTIRLLDGVVDIYMPDFKFWDPAVAKRLANAEDYPERAREAIKEMHRQVGDL